MMPWNPEIYNQFKTIRYQPFFDLMNLVNDENLQQCVDIGCGTGEQTAILSKQFPNAHFIGIDSSAEMLEGAAKLENNKLQFKLATTEQFIETNTSWDLIFSNAALQWSYHHYELFPKLISKLNKGGQLAVQMPFQKENLLNKILINMVKEPPFANYLNGFIIESPVLQMDEYAKIMFDNDMHGLTVVLKVYPLIANNEMELYNFIAGSALIPYMEKLDHQQQSIFKSEYITRIQAHFKSFPAIYSFKRILLYGTKT